MINTIFSLVRLVGFLILTFLIFIAITIYLIIFIQNNYTYCQRWCIKKSINNQNYLDENSLRIKKNK